MAQKVKLVLEIYEVDRELNPNDLSDKNDAVCLINQLIEHATSHGFLKRKEEVKNDLRLASIYTERYEDSEEELPPLDEIPTLPGRTLN